MANRGCSYGLVNRNMIETNRGLLETFKKEFKEFREEIRDEFKAIKSNQQVLFNHQSSRVPKDVAKQMAWLYGVLGTISGGVIVGLIVKLFGVFL